MCKQSGTTQTVVQNPTVPDWLSTQFQNLATRAETLSNTPYNPGIQKNVADFSPDQIAAFDMTRQNVGEFRPYTDAAAGYAQLGGSTIGANQIANYSNPFQQQVIDATMANIQQNNALQQQNLRGNAALQGGLGNDRLGVAQSELARNQNLATNQTLAQLNAQNYNQALGAAQADRSAAQTAAGQFSNLGTTVSNLAAGDAARLSAAGGLQQALAQQQLDTTSANIAQQENYPYAQASFLGGMLQGASPTFTGTQVNTTQPGPSTLNQILGLGAVGLGAFMGSDPRIKNDLGEVGKLDDGTPIHAFRYKDDPSGKTFFGPMSTDVADDKKVSVGPDGIEMVDYAAVAEDAQEARDGYYTGGTVQLARFRNPTQASNQPQGPGPYQGGAAGLDALAMQSAMLMGQPVQTPRLPTPKTRTREMADEASDLADNFRMGQGLHRAAGKAMGQMSRSNAGGWSTEVTPASGEGTRNMLASGLGSLMGMASGGRVGYNLGGGVYGPAAEMIPGSPSYAGQPGPYPQLGGNIVPPAPAPAQRPGAGRFAAKGLAPFAGQGAIHNEMESTAAAMPSPGATQNEMETAAAMMPAPSAMQNEMETLAAMQQGVGGADGGGGQVSASSPTPGGLGSLGFGSNPALGHALMAGGAAFAGGRNIGEGLARAMPGALQAYRSVQMDEAAKKQRDLQNRIAEQRAAQAMKEFEARKLENQVAERTKVADQQGLTGPLRQQFILTGDLPSNMTNPTGDETFGVTPRFVTDPETGKIRALVVGNRGSVRELQPPTGGDWTGTLVKREGPTETTFHDPYTGAIVKTVPKNIADAEAAKKIGQAEGEAAVSVGKQRALVGQYEMQQDLVIEDVDRALNGINWSTVGWAGLAGSYVPGTPAHNLQRTLETIKANIGFDKLQAMRDASPTGGALGQVSEMENRLLQAVWGSLEQSQSGDQLRYNLDRLKKTIERLRVIRKDALADLEKDATATRDRVNRQTRPDMGRSDSSSTKPDYSGASDDDIKRGLKELGL